VVECIEQRALSLQGLGISPSRLEPIQLVKYAPTQSYHFHTDWFTDEQHASASLGGNRVSSIFAYVQADGVSGGGTNFPFLEPKRAEWCKFVDCDEEYEAGVTFKPVEGNAVFWENMVDLGDGIRRGDERVLHAGLPVVSGEKVGMNIWLREGRLPDEFRGL
jgi:prolyl 4-hydroxylase